jgi:dienelactone hydrolase
VPAPSLRTTTFVTIVVLIVVLGVAGRPYFRGTAFVVEAAGLNGWAHRVTAWQIQPVQRHDLFVPSRHGSLRAYAYQPANYRGARGVLLVPGVHAAGIDEPRLAGFAGDLAGMGHRVLTVELPDLAHYQITSRTTEMIEDAAAWMLRQPEYHGPDGRIGMMGISFGGGLALVAAGRSSIASRVAFGLSLGGHGDLPRTLRYLCTGIQADGAVRPPHDYGLAIVLLNVADAVVPPSQVKPLRDAIFSFLEASRLDMVDKQKAAAEFAHAKALEAMLEEPAHTYMGYVNARAVARLGPLLLPTLAARGGDPSLSPARSEPPQARVFLLHGTDDNVVPAIESTLLAQHLRERGVQVELLETPLITHAEVDRASSAADIWRLIHFWTKLLDE